MSGKKGCGGGLPCIYVDRHKWIPWEDISYKHYSPPKIKSNSWKEEDTTLFIMIASFRDKLCPYTLFNAFSKAKYPKRVHVGVVEQRLDDDVNCVQEYCRLIQLTNSSHDGKCPFIDNIRVAQKNAQQSKVTTTLLINVSTLTLNSILIPCVLDNRDQHGHEPSGPRY